MSELVEMPYSDFECLEVCPYCDEPMCKCNTQEDEDEQGLEPEDPISIGDCDWPTPFGWSEQPGVVGVPLGSGVATFEANPTQLPGGDQGGIRFVPTQNAQGEEATEPALVELGGLRGAPGLGRLGNATGRRLRARAFFLTYSQSELEKAPLYEFLVRGRVKRLIIAQETHEDGGKHFHALVEYDVRKDVVPTHFDFGGEHPNVRIAGVHDNFDNWVRNHWNYCKKEDAFFLTLGEDPPEVTNRKRKRDEVFAQAMVVAVNIGVNDAMEILYREVPYEAVVHGDAIQRSLLSRRNAAQPIAPARPLSSFQRLPLIVEGWTALYLCGPTATGKTSLARALLPEAKVVRHRDQLRDCDFSKGIIFDDFDVRHWPPTAVIHLLDWEEPSGIDVKHSHVVIPPRTRKIITSNHQFDRWIPENATDEQASAMRRRLQVIVVHTSVY